MDVIDQKFGREVPHWVIQYEHLASLVVLQFYKDWIFLRPANPALAIERLESTKRSR